MATPEFILRLREKVGTDELWLNGVTAVIVDGDRMLLVRRADTGDWTPVTGIIDPGEQPADAAVREALEEAGVVIEAERLASVDVTDLVVYPNGDRSRFIDLAFRCRWVSGEPHPADGENTDARWFGRGELPAMKGHYLERIRAALADQERTEFRGGGFRGGGALPDAPRAW